MRHGQFKGIPLPYFLCLPDSGAGGAAGGEGAGGQAGGASSSVPAGGSSGGAAGSANGTPPAGGAPEGGSGGSGESGGQVERPAWLPDKFKEPEALATAYKELERRQFQRVDQLKADVRKEIEAERLASVPASPGDYTFEPIKLPDGKEIRLNADDPLVPWFQDRAHKMGLSQEQYSELVKDFVERDLQRGPVWEKEVQTLGCDSEQAEMRLKRIEGWMRGNAPQEIYNAFAGIPATANMVKLFEHVMTLAGEPAIRVDDTSSFTAKASPDTLREMMADPRYWRDKDPVFVKQVRAVSRKLAGE